MAHPRVSTVFFDVMSAAACTAAPPTESCAGDRLPARYWPAAGVRGDLDDLADAAAHEGVAVGLAEGEDAVVAGAMRGASERHAQRLHGCRDGPCLGERLLQQVEAADDHVDRLPGRLLHLLQHGHDAGVRAADHDHEAARRVDEQRLLPRLVTRHRTRC